MKSTQKTLNVYGQREHFGFGTQRNLYSTDSHWGFALGDTKTLRNAKHTNMLVSFALGDAKVWRWGSKPTPVPNANGFASQWNIGLNMILDELACFCLSKCKISQIEEGLQSRN